MSEKKIILNWLPPASVYIPSSAMSILKKNMEDNGYDAQVIYWNIIMQKVWAFFPSEDELTRLVPFMAVLAGKYNDKRANRRLAFYLQNIKPENKSLRGNIKRQVDELGNSALRIINNELDKIPLSAVLLFGISCHFNQWIPGMILAGEIKKRSPKIPVVVGGLSGPDTAIEMLKICSDFDFAIWGEGEAPLLSLSDSLKESSGKYQDVPRLAYKLNGQVKISATDKSEYLDFRNHPLPSYEDYFAEIKGKINIGQVHIPINTARGCSWNHCHFCRFNAGYKYREREPEKVIKEIKQLNKTYDVKKFIFVDNDIVGRDQGKFSRLLDGLISLPTVTGQAFEFIGEVIPTGFDEALIKKMVLAGFQVIHVGYEAITDGLLKKMNKRNRFADNIIFLKFLTKYSMNSMAANIIPGIPDESEDDVLDSIENLHYIRFFLSADPKIHSISQFRMSKNSAYYKKNADRPFIDWQDDPAAQFFPSVLLNNGNRFDFFDYQGVNKNENIWGYFHRINEYYKRNIHTYKLLSTDGSIIYREYLNDKLISQVLLDNPEYWEVLTAANYKVISFDQLMAVMKEKYSDITSQKVISIIDELQNNYLLYSDNEHKTIISIIDTGILS